MKPSSYSSFLFIATENCYEGEISEASSQVLSTHDNSLPFELMSLDPRYMTDFVLVTELLLRIQSVFYYDWFGSSCFNLV